jgi:phosphate transport system protein
MEIGKHISQQYNHELETLRNSVLKMGGLVESQSKNAVKALLDRDDDLAELVATSDYEVNKMEVEIDEECAQIIARRQPAASDLRLILAVTKVITDLERIGDEAEKIGRFAIKLAKKDTVSEMHAELSHLGNLVLEMLHESLDCFARMDADQAMKIVSYDEKIDNEFNTLSRLLITHMMEDTRNVKNVLRIIWCARSLERIGDHAQNICEYVIYLVKGKDIRHTSTKQVRAQYFASGE